MSKLPLLATNDEGFVFDPTGGDSFQVSPAGLVILNGLKAGRSDEAIAESLTEKYEVGLEEARRDVAEFRGSLKSLGLL